MKKLLNLFFKYYILIISLLIFNEFTLAYFDKTPPLSNDSLSLIRKINFSMLIFFFYIKYFYLNDKFNFINEKLFIFFKRTSYVLFILIIFDIFLKFVGLGINKHWYDESNIRFNSPYDMFSNKPGILDHNKFGFRGPNLSTEISGDTLSIAFLGGSTGYTGTPPIPELLSNNLTNSGVKNIIYNFSVNSSNHNQHIHRLVKQIKYSSIFGIIENRTGLISGINISRKKINSDFDSWSDSIVNNYTSTIQKAKLIFGDNLKTNKCKKLIFIPILQPVNPKTKNEVKLWNKMKKSIKDNSNFINYSNIDKGLNFFDNVHIDQVSRVKIANLMNDDLLNVIKSKCSN